MSTDSPAIQRHQWPDEQDTSKSYALSGRIMLASIIILFFVVIFLVLLHLYARWHLLRHPSRRRTNRRNHVVFYVDNNSQPTSHNRGLHASVLKTLPVFVFSPENTAPECAVCLSEFQQGETGRVLPKCQHSFHTECIDMWFFSHSTCPLCRSPVEAVVEPEIIINPIQHDENNVNINILSDVSGPGLNPVQHDTGDRGKQRVDVRIDVPSRNEVGIELQLTSPSQEFRSPGSRLLSRIINMSRKSPAVSPSGGVGPSCGPVAAESDVESARHESEEQESSRQGNIR